MKLRSYAAIIFSSALLVSQTPAIAQTGAADTLNGAPADAPRVMPQAETPQSETPQAETAAPDTTPIAPSATPETQPLPESSQPAPTNSTPLPTLESTPVPSAAPATMAVPSGAVPTATTMVLPKETITGIKTVSLPEPLPVRPAYFTLPIILKVAQDTGVTSSTPISDRYTGKENWDLAAWMSGVQNCLQQKPKLMRVVGDESVPFMLNGAEGTIMLNADNRPVCPT